MRVFKVARSWKELNRIINAIGRSVASVGWLSVLLLLMVFVFALMGMQIFGYRLQWCDVAGAQPLCPPGLQEGVDCADHPDCYVPCQPDQVGGWFTVPGSPYNDQAYCERFPRDSSSSSSSSSLVANASDLTYLAQVGSATVARSNFDNIGWGLLTVFQTLTLENWNDVMVRLGQDISLLLVALISSVFVCAAGCFQGSHHQP